MGFKQYKSVCVRVVLFCFGSEQSVSHYRRIWLAFFFHFLNLVSFTFLGRTLYNRIATIFVGAADAAIS